MRVISNKYLPVTFPVTPTIVTWLLMDRLNASGIAWGIVGTLFALLWIGALYRIFTQEAVHPSQLPRVDEA